jgi:hypothetical protein
MTKRKQTRKKQKPKTRKKHQRVRPAGAVEPPPGLLALNAALAAAAEPLLQQIGLLGEAVGKAVLRRPLVLLPATGKTGEVTTTRLSKPGAGTGRDGQEAT